ncbi:MAG TPA: hypothetical protein VJ571_02465 [Candidatus Nitrosotalea sp.]|nr:hypothetical protein [Candidatus Nitrosotalea sp.]
MTVTAEGRIMKVGNSLVMVLPKIVCDNYKLSKGEVLQIAMTDNGIFIPVKLNDSAFVKKELENALKSLSGKGNQK